MKEKSRNYTFDVLNILACVGVVLLHHNGLVHSYNGGTRGWVQSLIVECLFYFCVPVFFMLSGANLLAYKQRYDVRCFIKKRIERTVIPWLGWSVIILFLKMNTGGIKLEPYTLKQALTLIFSYRVEPVYWFFGALFPCYLVMPILTELSENRKILWYIVSMNFIFVSVLPLVNRWLDFSWTMKVPITADLLIFVVLGYLLSTKPPERRLRILIYFFGFASVLFRFFYTWHFSIINGKTDTSIKGYTTFHSVLYACAVFLAVQQIPWNRILSDKIKNKLPDIADCSFGVILLHPMVMKCESLVLGIGDDSWIWRIICAPLTYMVTLCIVKMLRKMPLLKRLMG